ncbi:MAG TPA: hypothetical protein VGG27_13420 [Magnetospirillaceae bacterium]|jgi:hypothetical protein
MTSLREHLIAHGLDEIQAEVWENFTDAVLDAFAQAQQMLKSTPYWEQYCALKGAFLKVPKKKKKGSPQPACPAEDGLTDALGQCLNYIRKAVGVDHPLRKLEVAFSVQAQIPTPFKIGRLSRRTDIKAESYCSTDAPELIFEAKLVRTDADLPRYLGTDGLGRFIDPAAPYTKGPMGVLVAYTVSDSIASWTTKILNSLNGPPALATSSAHVRVPSITETFLCSQVERPALQLSPISMLHVVTAFVTHPPT